MLQSSQTLQFQYRTRLLELQAGLLELLAQPGPVMAKVAAMNTLLSIVRSFHRDSRHSLASLADLLPQLIGCDSALLCQLTLQLLLAVTQHPLEGAAFATYPVARALVPLLLADQLVCSLAADVLAMLLCLATPQVVTRLGCEGGRKTCRRDICLRGRKKEA